MAETTGPVPRTAVRPSRQVLADGGYEQIRALTATP